MDFYFESDHVVGEQFRDVVLRRARTATRRLSYAVSQAKVKFTQVFRSGGVSNQQCRVELTVGDTSTVVATARAADWSEALDGALRRATSALWRIKLRSRLRSRHTLLAVTSNDDRTNSGSDAGRSQIRSGSGGARPRPG